MYKLRFVIAAATAALWAATAGATTFIVPTDEEMVDKSTAIVTGVVTGSEVIESEPRFFETVYTVAVDRTLKGSIQDKSRIRVRSYGGGRDGFFTHVESAAHFAIGDEVLLFLTPHRGDWTTTDLTLGKFRFATSSAGYGLLVRDAEDIVGWDRDGKVHKEKVRLEAEFLEVIRARVAGQQRPAVTYEVEAEDVLAAPAPRQERFGVTTHALFAAHTYASRVTDCATTYPVRHETAQMNAGITYFKNTNQDIADAGDGGVSAIQSGLASWSNECSAAVSIVYGGEQPTLKNGEDGINMIIFNDPGSHVSGTWTGSGTIAITFGSANNLHTFDGTTFASYSDNDIVFQNAYGADEPSFAEAMTHEIGHSIGLRHANRTHPRTVNASCVLNAETSCNDAIEECASSAIMTSAVTHGIDFTLQTWDAHAANALYPATCAVAPTPPTNVTATALTSTSVQITWSAVDGATTYDVFRSSGGGTFTELAGSDTAGTTFTDNTAAANTAYRYVVRAGNGGGFSEFSASDMATTVIFTDATLTAQVSEVKLVHFTQLLTAVNAVRTLGGLSTISFGAPAPAAGVEVFASHLNTLRTNLLAGLAAVPHTVPTFTDTVTTGTSLKLIHIQEMRDAVQ